MIVLGIAAYMAGLLSGVVVCICIAAAGEAERRVRNVPPRPAQVRDDRLSPASSDALERIWRL